MREYHRQILKRIQVCLSNIGMYSKSAEKLIFLTGSVESKYKYLRQVGNELARSYWQVEPLTCLDNVNNYLKFRRTRLKTIADACMVDTDVILGLDEESASELLEINLNFAIANARLKYWRNPSPLPKADDYEGLGQYWLKVYNAGGKGSMEKWKEAINLIW